METCARIQNCAQTDTLRRQEPEAPAGARRSKFLWRGSVHTCDHAANQTAGDFLGRDLRDDHFLTNLPYSDAQQLLEAIDKPIFELPETLAQIK